jgi:cytochrome c peroxidase
MRLRFSGFGAAATLASAALLTIFTIALTRSTEPSVDDAFAGYRADLMRLDDALARLDATLAGGDGPRAQRAFRDARTAFKRIELFVEYHGHFAARDVNGPPLFHAEDEDPENPLGPAGLQVIESELFPVANVAHFASSRHQIGFIRVAVARLHAVGADTMPGDAFLFDAMRQELARVATLGIAGFDATSSGDAMVESADAIDGIVKALSPYRRTLARHDRVTLDTLDAQFAAATRYLRAHPNFERFDRLEFIARYVQPLAHSLARAQRVLDVGQSPRPRAWSTQSASIYDRDAFDAMSFAATDAPRATPELIALGRELFFDPRLSPSGTRSCASCHPSDHAFMDGLPRAALLAGHVARGGGRNTPTLLNAALQPTLFDDGRVRTLEDQATDVLGSAAEMGGSLDRAASALHMQPGRIRLALASYVRSLVALNSRFDRAVRGDTTALTAQERNGFNLFMGKARCATCHFAPLFNGAAPPMLVESEPEVIGVPASASASAHDAVIDPDSGRFNVRRIDLHLFAFKVPTVRNVELTAPYMHNGVFRSLDEVVDFYDGGGGNGLGIRVRQTLPTDSLHLTRDEKSALVAFMRALTDTAVAR